MKTIAFILLTAGLCLGAKNTSADLLTRLRDDAKRAASVPEIKDKDRKTIDKAIQKLDKNIDAASQGKATNAGDIRKALGDIGKVAKQSFNEEDRKVVYSDMAAIRDRKLDKEKATKQPRNNMPRQRTSPFPNARRPGRR